MSMRIYTHNFIIKESTSFLDYDKYVHTGR